MAKKQREAEEAKRQALIQQQDAKRKIREAQLAAIAIENLRKQEAAKKEEELKKKYEQKLEKVKKKAKQQKEALVQKLEKTKQDSAKEQERIKNVTMDIVKEVIDPIIQEEKGHRQFKVIYHNGTEGTGIHYKGGAPKNSTKEVENQIKRAESVDPSNDEIIKKLEQDDFYEIDERNKEAVQKSESEIQEKIKS